MSDITVGGGLTCWQNNLAKAVQTTPHILDIYFYIFEEFTSTVALLDSIVFCLSSGDEK